MGLQRILIRWADSTPAFAARGPMTGKAAHAQTASLRQENVLVIRLLVETSSANQVSPGFSIQGLVSSRPKCDATENS